MDTWMCGGPHECRSGWEETGTARMAPGALAASPSPKQPEGVSVRDFLPQFPGWDKSPESVQFPVKPSSQAPISPLSPQPCSRRAQVSSHPDAGGLPLAPQPQPQLCRARAQGHCAASVSRSSCSDFSLPAKCQETRSRIKRCKFPKFPPLLFSKCGVLALTPSGLF